ncbi:MAG: DUF2933 domain-containing protein [Roseateles sp.]
MANASGRLHARRRPRWPVLLLTEHLTHFTQAIPYLFLLACPLMHLFGHHHGGQHQHGNDEAREKQSRP